MEKTRKIAITKRDILGISFVSLPILIYWIYWTLHPSYWFNIDPAAVYFLDSLSVFIGKPYVFVDHPGTPVQVVGSLLLAITYPFFDNRDAFIRFFISRPNAFFLITNVFLLAINLLCVVIFYKTVSSSLTKNKTVGALAISLLFFAIHPQSYQSLTFWSHNSLNFPIGALLLVWLYRELQNTHTIKSSRLILIGFAFGVYSMAQIYFLAWPATLTLIIFLYSYRTDANILRAAKTALYPALGAVIGIITMLIPIYRELPRLAGWLSDVATHTGAYGTGESGFITFSLIQSAVTFWWALIRPMIILLILSVVALAVISYWNNRSNLQLPSGDFAMIAGLLFHILLILFVMLKASVQLRYSLPLAAILPLLVFVLIKSLESISKKSNKAFLLFYLLILAGVLFTLVNQKSTVDNRSDVEQIAQKGKSQAVNQLAKRSGVDEENIVVVYAYGVPLKCAGLLHASNWIGNFRDEIADVCPSQFAVWDTMSDPNTAIPITDISDIDWDLVIWPGNGSNLDQYLHANGAANVPRPWHVEYSKWFFVHPESTNK